NFHARYAFLRTDANLDQKEEDHELLGVHHRKDTHLALYLSSYFLYVGNRAGAGWKWQHQRHGGRSKRGCYSRSPGRAAEPRHRSEAADRHQRGWAIHLHFSQSWRLSGHGQP